ncbi:MAG: response regulator transcription factor [Treponema sp.]|jgi:DNA-binding NarL/FixJ family response regulator|nr:response regulator transcription factor [Treponema sp.]
MLGGTLLVTRHTKMHEHYKKVLTDMGFRNITVTSEGKDGLIVLINELKPRLLMIGAAFYKSATPFMMSLLLERFPYLNIAAISLVDYPAEYGVDFINYGVNSCIYKLDGIEQYNEGLECIRDGKTFISESVNERMALRSIMPERPKVLTPQQFEIAKLISNCLEVAEIASLLQISERTVYYQKSMIYARLNVESDIGVLRVGHDLGLLDPNDLIFISDNYLAKPWPERETKKTHDRKMYLVKSGKRAKKMVQNQRPC